MAALSGVFDPRFERRSGGERQELSLPARVVAHEWKCHSVELVEVSPGGFRGLTSDRVFAGDLIRVAIPAIGAFDARVKWSDGTAFGAEFCSPADLRLLFLGGPVARRSTWLERRAA